MKIVKRFSFNSAHYLPNYVGKCKQMHGHTYVLDIVVEGEINSDTGMVMDFSDLKYIVTTKALDQIDHKLLNDIILNPTAENTLLWIKEKIQPHLKGLVTLRLWENIVDESYVEL